jgi:hypothetical protein
MGVGGRPIVHVTWAALITLIVTRSGYVPPACPKVLIVVPRKAVAKPAEREGDKERAGDC